MKLISITLLFFASTFFLFGQNLVQNSDFENLSSEPCGLINNSIEFNEAMDNWLVANNSSPDIYLTSIDQMCWNFQPNSSYSGPIGIKGSQDPHSGNAFVGIYAYTIEGLNQRDYIQVELNSPMISGEEYIVEFYASLADSIEFAMNGFGAYLSSTPISGNDDGPMLYEAQLVFDDFISDSENWVRIADTILADDAYEYITIGNFNDDNATSVQANPLAADCIGCYGSYYYIDDVSIMLLTASSINETADDPIANTYPNPFSNWLNISSSKNIEDATISIYDLSGSLQFQIYESSLSEYRIDASDLPIGCYILEIAHSKGSEQFKIMKSN